MTLYRGMDIGTAKPTPAERGRVPHHLLDVLDPWESANVAWWLERAAACVADIEDAESGLLRRRDAVLSEGTLVRVVRGAAGGPDFGVDWKRRPRPNGREALHADWRSRPRISLPAAPERRPSGRSCPGGVATDRQADQRMAAARWWEGDSQPRFQPGALSCALMCHARAVRPYQPARGGNVRGRLGRRGSAPTRIALSASVGRRRRPWDTAEIAAYLDGSESLAATIVDGSVADPAIRQKAADLVRGPGCDAVMRN